MTGRLKLMNGCQIARITSYNELMLIDRELSANYFYHTQKPKKPTAMKTLYEISSHETGTVIIRRRKIAKALRRWLRENEVAFNHRFFVA